MIRQRFKTIPLSDIQIPKMFTETTPEPMKVIEKTALYYTGHKLPPMRIDRNNALFDGYITYLILLNTGEVKARCIVEWEEKPKRKKKGSEE